MSTQQRIASGLYLVATPIGNLDDISRRALEVLKQADVVAAEDTRHSRRLLQHYAIAARMLAYHEHNEDQQTPVLLARLADGAVVALVSDAGTPLVSDPGYRLVQAAHEKGIDVIPVPGCCAAIAALSASGLPTDAFLFEGFPPNKRAARSSYYQSLAAEKRTMVFYESCHRVVESLKDMANFFGDKRRAVVARELTKKFETIRRSSLAELLQWIQADENQQKGEFVLVVSGADKHAGDELDEAARVLRVLVGELPVKQAAGIAAQLTGMNKNRLYQMALELKNNNS